MPFQSDVTVANHQKLEEDMSKGEQRQYKDHILYC